MEPRPRVFGSQSFSHWTTSLFLSFLKKIIYLVIFGCRGSLLPQGLFSSCIQRGLLSVNHWVCGLLPAVAPLAVEHRLQGTDSVAVARGLSVCGERAWLLRGFGDLPDLGREPVSPASAGRFFTTEPPGKPSFFSYYKG